MSNDLLNRLARDPNVLIHQIDAGQDRAAVVALSAEQIRAAAFLDQRAITPQTQGALFAWDDIVNAMRDAPDNAPVMIFHIGHCGSTLISKLIEAAGGPRALREPLPLRTFAMMEANITEGLSVWREGELTDRLKLFLRSCATEPRSAVKATSMCNNLIAPVIASGVQKILFVYMPAETYLAAMLGGENAALDIYGSIELRMRRLRTLCGGRIDDLADLSLGECAALCWACETATTASLSGAGREKQILTVNFDRFLETPGPSLGQFLKHFDAPADDARLHNAVTGPLMTQYSKAPEHQFSPNFREELLAQYRRERADEIAKGMAWLEARGRAHPPIAKALEHFSN